MNLEQFELRIHRTMKPMLDEIKNIYRIRDQPLIEYYAYDIAGHTGILWFQLHRKRFLLPGIHMFDIAIPIVKHGNYWKVDNDYAMCRADPALIDELRKILRPWSKVFQKSLHIKGFEFLKYRLRI